jgi:succinylglutamate desuccinylase
MLECELQAFHGTRDRPMVGRARVEKLDEHGFVLRPQGAVPAEDGRDIDLLLLALVHGDEYAGLSVLNTICRHLEAGVIDQTVTIAFLLGNVEAARAGRRFLDRDLNRSFARAQTDTHEDRRAREIERVLVRTRYCLDLHQTIEPSGTPFFVFAYSEQDLRFARAVGAGLPVVTYPSGKFSELTKGLTLGEFHPRVGGVGVAVELGQKGFGFYSEAAGLKLALNAISTVKSLAAGGELPELSETANPLYTWQAVVPYPVGEVVLEEGLVNFQPIARGQRLGMNGRQPIEAPASGILLFPKYIRSPDEPRPAELYRLLRRVPLAEMEAGETNDADDPRPPARRQASRGGDRHAR